MRCGPPHQDDDDRAHQGDGVLAADESAYRPVATPPPLDRVRAGGEVVITDLTESELAEAERDWEDFWAATRPVEHTTTVEHHADHLARAHALRGAQAVHLASALAVGAPGLIIAAWDRRQIGRAHV